MRALGVSSPAFEQARNEIRTRFEDADCHREIALAALYMLEAEDRQGFDETLARLGLEAHIDVVTICLGHDIYQAAA
jgi:hypothetical protein